MGSISTLIYTSELILCFTIFIPIKCFVSHRPTDPFFWKKKIRITCKEASTLVYKHTILSLTLRFCSLFRLLIVLFLLYHLITNERTFVLSSQAFTGKQNPSCVHSFFFCPTNRPTFTRGRAMGNETSYWDGHTNTQLKFMVKHLYGLYYSSHVPARSVKL